MKTITSGIIAGFIATVVLSAIMVMKSVMGLMPQLDVIGMLASGANNWVGLPASPAVGWVIHFIVGTVLYGIAFALFNHALPGHSQTVKGVVLAVIGWLIMMAILMPMMGKGFLGFNIGVMAPVMTFILHLVFGAVLGWSYHLLRKRSVTAS
jgi:hypothetical protein